MEKKVEYKWPPLESDPDILTKYMQKLGMPTTWELQEVIGIEPDLLPMVPSTTTALVLAFDYRSGKGAKEVDIKPGDADFFMLQTGGLDNACGLIACIHAVFNNLHKVKILPGSSLEKYFLLSQKMTPEERAKALDNFNEIKEKHQECGKEGQSEYVKGSDTIKYHFSCFLLNPKGDLIELDGLNKTPSLLKEKCPPEEFISTTANEILMRVGKGMITERMALMALTPLSP